MALRLRLKFTRILNPNPKSDVIKFLSTSAPDAEIQRVEAEAPVPRTELKTLVEKLLTFDDEEGKGKVKKDDEVSVRKRMLDKMRDEWKVFKDGGGGKSGGGMGDFSVLGLEEAEANAELGEVREEEKVWRGVRNVDLEDSGKGKRRDAEMMEAPKARMLVGSMKMEEKGRTGNMEEKESTIWNFELGEVEGGNDGARDEEKVKLTENKDSKKKIKTKQNASASSNLEDTLQMLKTAKKKLSGKEADLKALSKKLLTPSLDNESIKSCGLSNGVKNEQLLDKLKKLEIDLDEEKEQLRLYRDEVVQDCTQKLQNAVHEAEKRIKLKFDEALKESSEELQHLVQDDGRQIKTTGNQLLMESYSKLHKLFRVEKGRLVSSYNNDSTDSS